MDLNSIKKIREYRDDIRIKIKSTDIKKFKDSTFGAENEYSYKGLIGGIEALLTDVTALTKAPTKFVKLSTHAERNAIVSSLNQVLSYIDNPTELTQSFESLKVQLRKYNLRYLEDRHIEFDDEIQEVRKIKLELQQVYKDSKTLFDDVDKANESLADSLKVTDSKLEEIDEELDRITKRKELLIEQSADLREVNTELTDLKELANTHLTEITESLTEVKSNEKLISTFASTVRERENKLGDLEQKTDENTTKLAQYEEQRISILKEANELIKSAKQALKYSTAEGISAAFQNQYENSNKKIIFGSWIAGAIVCLICTIGLGIWILEESQTSLGIMIGRISLLPLPIIGAVFCANQYTKQKNIIEDYAYKMVLSKAIVGFSEELKKNGSDDSSEYVHYIKTALEEIHRDPLRSRQSKNENKAKDSNLKDLVEMAERIVNMTKNDS